MKTKFNQEDPTIASGRFGSDNQSTILAGDSLCGKHCMVTLAPELFRVYKLLQPSQHTQMSSQCHKLGGLLE